MGYVHHCVFCGWRRRSPTSTVVAPHCEQCGCVLHSSPEAQFEDREPLRVEPVAAIQALRHPRVARAARLATLAFAALLVVVSTGAAWQTGGLLLADCVFGVTALAFVWLLFPES